jgi:hypothetical protein
LSCKLLRNDDVSSFCVHGFSPAAISKSHFSLTRSGSMSISDRAFGPDRLERSHSYPRDLRGAKEPILAAILRRNPVRQPKKNVIAPLPLVVISFAPCAAWATWGPIHSRAQRERKCVRLVAPAIPPPAGVCGGASLRKTLSERQPRVKFSPQALFTASVKMASSVNMPGISKRYGNRIPLIPVCIGPRLRRKRRTGHSPKPHQAEDN